MIPQHLARPIGAVIERVADARFARAFERTPALVADTVRFSSDLAVVRLPSKEAPRPIHSSVRQALDDHTPKRAGPPDAY